MDRGLYPESMRLIAITLLYMMCLTGFAQQGDAYQALLDSALNASARDSLTAAATYYRRALSLVPDHPGNSLVWGNLGSVQERLGQRDEAVNSYTIALNLQPALLPVLLRRAELYMDRGDAARAMLDYSAVLDQQPAHEQALLGRAWLRMEQRMFSEARLDFETLLVHYPQHKQGELGLAILCQKQERFKEAAERFAALLERYPKEAYLYEARGNMEKEARWYELALIDYEEAWKLSNDPHYWVMQALVYLDQNKKSSARRMLNRAVNAGMNRASLQDIYAKCK